MGRGKKKYKYDIVADRILEGIRKGRWKVGDKLPPETELALESCVSRVCLGEGLKRLNALGIARIMQGDGTHINEVSPFEFMKPLFNLLTVTENNIDKIYSARLFVESGACRLTARNRTEKEIKVPERCLNNMEETIAFSEFASYSKYDRKFHDLLVSASKNRILVLISQMFNDIAQRYTDHPSRDPRIVSRSMMGRRQLFGVMEDGDGDFTCHIMQVHLECSRRALLDIEHSEWSVLPFRMRGKGSVILGKLLAGPAV